MEFTLQKKKGKKSMFFMKINSGVVFGQMGKSMGLD